MCARFDVVLLFAGLLPVSQPDSPDVKKHLARGHAWYGLAEWEKAAKEYTQVLERDPKNVEALIYRGGAFREQGALDKAMKDMDEAILLAPKNALTYFGRGETWSLMGRMDEAITDFTASIKLDPKNERAFVQRSYCHLRKQDWNSASEDVEEALRLNPKFVPALYTRGILRQGQGAWAEAIADFDAAVKLDETYAYAYANKATILAACPDAKVRDGKAALKAAKRACELTKWGDPYVLEAYAAAAAECGDFDEAVKWQKKVVDNDAYCKWYGIVPVQRLLLYEEKRPYRMTQPKRDPD